MGQRYNRMEDQKSGLGWHATRILLKGEDLNERLKCFPKMIKLEEVISKLVSLKGSTDGGLSLESRSLGVKPPAVGKFFL